MDDEEAEHFRRIQMIVKIERATEVIEGYRRGIDIYRDKTNKYNRKLGRTAERLREPDEEDDD